MEHPYDTPDTPGDAQSRTASPPGSEWPARITRIVARELRFWRERRSLSAQQLSDRTKELGYHVPRSVIANLENDRRDIVTVAELLIFAAALDIPPTMLITPVGRDETVEILPGLEVSSWRSRGWVLGSRHPDYKTFVNANWDDSRRAIVLYDIHRLLVEEFRQVETRIKRVVEGVADDTRLHFAASGSPQQRREILVLTIREMVSSLSRLHQHRQRIQAEGYVLPELRPGLAVLLADPNVENGMSATGDQQLWSLDPEQLVSLIVSEILSNPDTPSTQDRS